jgi:hypothetical protein
MVSKSPVMKTLIVTAFFCLASFAALAQTAPGKTNTPDTTKKIMVVEASCGQCKFGLKGKGCSLAVRVKDTAYFVDGSAIDDHGDAHAADGFCETIRTAEVQGTVVNNRFIATYFKVLPQQPKKKG